MDKLPSTLQELIISGNFNKSVDKLPSTLQKLVIYGNFNKSVDKLPSTLKILTLSGKFNKSVDKLPKKIKIMYIYGNFNKSLEHLPKSVKHIGFSGKINQLNTLNKNITSIALYGLKNIHICNSMNIYIKSLIYHGENKKPISNYSLNIKYFEGQKSDKKIKKIPYGCKYEIIDNSCD